MPIARRTQRHVLDDPRSGHVLAVPGFLVFRGPDAATGTRPLRLVRQRGDRSGHVEVRDLTVVVTS